MQVSFDWKESHIYVYLEKEFSLFLNLIHTVTMATHRFLAIAILLAFTWLRSDSLSFWYLSGWTILQFQCLSNDLPLSSSTPDKTCMSGSFMSLGYQANSNLLIYVCVCLYIYIYMKTDSLKLLWDESGEYLNELRLG